MHPVRQACTHNAEGGVGRAAPRRSWPHSVGAEQRPTQRIAAARTRGRRCLASHHGCMRRAGGLADACILVLRDFTAWGTGALTLTGLAALTCRGVTPPPPDRTPRP
jgi:hypothetical protein